MNDSRPDLAILTNGQSVSLSEIPTLALDAFGQAVLGGVAARQRVCALFGTASPLPGATRLYAVLADDEQNLLFAATTDVTGSEFPSLTPRCPQVHLFEREIAEQFGLRPLGHPWFKPVRYAHSWTGRDAWNRPSDQPILPAVGDFYRVEGEQVHEVAVGPVHAGVIEPGHFRFQCHGEQVFHLEIALGYQHRGVEEALVGGPTARTLPYAETLSGDATVAHVTTYSQIIEELADCQVSARAQAVRGIALELERLANHIGDLGALAGDVGFLPTASYCGRIRGDFLNMTALLCGNRFGRGLIRPGGLGFELDTTASLNSAAASTRARRTPPSPLTFSGVPSRSWRVSKTPARCPATSPPSSASSVLRPAHRAWIAMCGATSLRASSASRTFLSRRAIREMSPRAPICAGLRSNTPSPSSAISFATFRRARPAARSGACARTPRHRPERGLARRSLPRGHHRRAGPLLRYKVVDPSFHNWPGLAYCLRNQEISDFPICNKSFNLSYCGHDL